MDPCLNMIYVYAGSTQDSERNITFYSWTIVVYLIFFFFFNLPT